MTYIDDLAAQIQNALPTAALPEGDTSDLFRIYAVLLLVKGKDVTREDVHNAWVAWMVTKGEVHESMVPFAELSPDTKDEDSPFVDAIRSVARSIAGRTTS